METFLFLLLIIGGEALFSWLKKNASKQKTQELEQNVSDREIYPEQERVPESPAEHLRELLRRYAEDHPEEIETSTSEPYVPDDEFFETWFGSVLLSSLGSIKAITKFESLPIVVNYQKEVQPQGGYTS